MFSTTVLSAAAACSLLFSPVHAHMKITSPVPYGQSSLNNSPLEPDGSDFPCKQRSGVYDITEMNNIAVGVPQQLSFMGGATHGGGSCQLSVTMDKNPDKNSQWKVIHSILGGCPNGASGNANGDPSYSGNPTFEYTMPKGMPNGEYTMAWTWFNKIGNREMYMNCAPISVTGGADDQEVYNSLPDMFQANIGNGCETLENYDLIFPECGLNVETVAQTALSTATAGNCAAPTGGSGSGGSGGSGSPASSPAAPTGYGGGPSSVANQAPSGYGGGPSSPSKQAPSSAAPSVPSYDDGSYKPYLAAAPALQNAPSYGSASARSSADAESPAPTGYGPGTKTRMVHETTFATITATAAPQATGYGSTENALSSFNINRGKASSGNEVANDTGTTSSSNCTDGSIACPTDGSIVCMQDGQWGLCNHGCAVPRALSQGTTCTDGVISKRDIAAHIKKHLRPHAHRF